MQILVIDNYDSFTYNLVHSVRKITRLPLRIARNDEISLSEIDAFDKIILSPGPGIPDEAGLLKSIIRKYASSKSILGVCLGHQAIGEVFGARLLNMERVIHGMATPVYVTKRTASLYAEIPDQFEAGRYHSWIIDNQGFPACLEVTGIDSENHIMSLQHREFDVQGVQFHPESVLTPLGEKILENWLFK